MNVSSIRVSMNILYISQAQQAEFKPWQQRALAGILGAAAAASIVFAGPAEAAVQPFLSSTGKHGHTVLHFDHLDKGSQPCLCSL